MATRKELIRAVGARYLGASRGEKKKMLDEFVALTATRFVGSKWAYIAKGRIREYPNAVYLTSEERVAKLRDDVKLTLVWAI